MTPPRIALSGRVTDHGGKHHTGVHVDYIHALTAAGGVPILLSPLMKPGHASRAMEGCNALVLTGGEDVHPSRYATEDGGRLGKTDPARDQFELQLFAEADARGLPVLAICRGLHLVNVAMGGSLWQDLPSEWGPEPALDHDVGDRWDIRSHTVSIRPLSKLAAAVACETLEVNSFHHQAIRRLAPGLVGSAESTDGVIEAAERADGGPWLVGVQWHPESFWRESDGPDLNLFRALVREAS